MTRDTTNPLDSATPLETIPNTPQDSSQPETIVVSTPSRPVHTNHSQSRDQTQSLLSPLSMAGEPASSLPLSKKPKLHRANWLPGQSGNPAGRTKAAFASIAKVRDLARTHTEAAIRTLADIMTNEDSKESSRVAAAECLLNRGWGKAESVATISIVDDGTANKLSDDELAAIAMRCGLTMIEDIECVEVDIRTDNRAKVPENTGFDTE